jgi:hypothetical protein
MSLVTVTQAIVLSGKSPSTFYRHLKTGKVSKASDGSGRIDTTELLRVYGELQPPPNRTSAPLPIVNVGLSQENEWLKRQVEQLQQDMRDLKSESLNRETAGIERERAGVEREKRLVALLEHKKESDSGIFSKLFK